MSQPFNQGSKPADSVEKESAQVEQLHPNSDLGSSRDPQANVDARLAQAKTNAVAHGGGSDKPEDGLNQDS